MEPQEEEKKPAVVLRPGTRRYKHVFNADEISEITHIPEDIKGPELLKILRRLFNKRKELRMEAMQFIRYQRADIFTRLWEKRRYLSELLALPKNKHQGLMDAENYETWRLNPPVAKRVRPKGKKGDPEWSHQRWDRRNALSMSSVRQSYAAQQRCKEIWGRGNK